MIPFPLNAQITLSISEIDPKLFIVTDVYSDDGEVIGQRPQEEIEAEMEYLEGRTRFRVLCVVNGRDQLKLESAVCLPNEREHSLACALDRAMHMLLGEGSPLK